MDNNRVLTDAILDNIAWTNVELMTLNKLIEDLISSPYLSYTTYPFAHRLVDRNMKLCTLPQDHADRTVSLEPYTVIKVNDAAHDREGRLWLYVTLPNHSSMLQRTKRGWILESNTVEYKAEELVSIVLDKDPCPFKKFRDLARHVNDQRV